MVPISSMLGMGVSLAISMLLPIGGLVWLMTRRAPDGSRRYSYLGRSFACGMLAFAIAQVATRLPLMAYLSTVDQPWAQFLLSAPVASFTAGLFEETGRLVIMLALMRRFHRWVDAVAFGLGHGGLEAILLVGLSTAVNLAVALMINAGQTPPGVPAAALEQLKAALVDTPSSLFYLAGLERISAVGLHIGLSLMVLWGIVAGRRLLGWTLAVLIHGTANLAIVLTASVLPLVVAELLLLVLVAAFWMLFVLRSRPRFPTEVVPLPAVDVVGPRQGYQGMPGKGAGKPAKGAGQPGKGSGQPGKGSGQPGKGSGQPGKGSGQPGKGSGQPGKGSSQPGKGSGQPGKGSGEPGKESGQGGRRSGEPGPGSGPDPTGTGG